MLRVVLTGGIGSGKSTVADMLQHLGAPIIDADESARQVVQPDGPALQAIKEHFGYKVLRPDGNLDRKRLRDIIFQNDHQRVWLERLLHPLIRDHMQQQAASLQAPYVVFVVPLLGNAQQATNYDHVVVVDVDTPLQLERAQQRDQSSRQQTEAIMQAQTNRTDRLALADTIIYNNGSLDELYQQVERLHQKLCQLATTHEN